MNSTLEMVLVVGLVVAFIFGVVFIVEGLGAVEYIGPCDHRMGKYARQIFLGIAMILSAIIILSLSVSYEDARVHDKIYPKFADGRYDIVAVYPGDEYISGPGNLHFNNHAAAYYRHAAVYYRQGSSDIVFRSDVHVRFRNADKLSVHSSKFDTYLVVPFSYVKQNTGTDLSDAIDRRL